MSYWQQQGGRRTRNSLASLDAAEGGNKDIHQPTGVPDNPTQSTTQPDNSASTVPTVPDQPMPDAAAAKPAQASGIIRKTPGRERWITQDLNPQSKPTSTSTPAGSPQHKDGRRSPNVVEVETEDDTRSDILQMFTPSGGAHSNPQADQTEESEGPDPQDPNKQQIDSVIKYLTNKVEELGPSYRNKVGWKDEFEACGKDLDAKIQDLILTCQSYQFLGALAQAYSLADVLTENVKILRNFARAQETQSSNPVLRPAVLTPRSQNNNLAQQEVPPGPLQQLPNASALGQGPDNVTLQETSSDIALGSQDGLSRNNLASFPKMVDNLRSKMKMVELEVSSLKQSYLLLHTTNSVKVNLTEFTKLQNEVNTLNQTVRELDHKVQDLQFPDLNNSVTENRNKISAVVAAGKRYEILANGFCKDIMDLKKGIHEYKSENTVLRAEIGVLRDTLVTQISREQNIPSANDNSVVTGEQILLQPQTNNTSATSIRGISSLQRPNVSVVTIPTTSIQAPVISTAFMQATRRSAVPPVMTNTNTFTNLLGNIGNGLPQDLPDREGEDGLDEASVSSRQSPANSTQSDDNSSNQRQVKRLKKAANELLLMLVPPVSEKLTKTVVIGIHKSKLLSVDSERKEVQRLLERYDKSTSEYEVDEEVITEIETAISRAKTWSSSMRDKYQELDCSKQSIDDKIYEGLKKFGEESEVNVFEFLKRFESFTEEKGSAKERAAYLFEKFLHKDIQLMVVEFKDEYTKMREWLIKRYGNVRTITDNIVKVIAKENKPSDDVPSSKLTSYYRKLDFVIKRIQELGKTVDMPIAELQAHIYSFEFINRLIAYTPQKATFELYDRLMAANINVLDISGAIAFKELSTVVHKHFVMNEGAAKSALAVPGNSQRQRPTEKLSPQRKKKSAHTVRETSCTSDRDSLSPAAHFTKSAKPRLEKKDGNAKQAKSKGTDSNHKFPCSLKNHDHEIGHCSDYFDTSAKDRRKSATYKSCFSCLGHFSKCKQKCKAKVPDDLLCTECKDWADQNNKSPLNILLCSNQNHTKPDNKDLMDSLKKYLKGFNPSKVSGPIKLAAHLYLAAHTKCCSEKTDNCSCKTSTRTRKPDAAQVTPFIDTSTGESVEISEDMVIPESKQEAFYVMQLLNMRGQDVLTFYDRGANMHLIEGQLAEDINLKVATDKPITIGVVGGGKVSTQYGTYAVNLGPTEDGFFYEISAQGIDKVTEKFPHYDLDKVNKEVIKTGKLGKGKHILPKYIGGQRAGLIVGIKNTGIEPVLMFQLPSGLGIYKSPLKDKFGSRYCYGGPDEVFTSVNKKLGPSFNHVNIYFTQVVNQYRNSFYPSLSCAIDMDEEESVLHPGIMFAKESGPTHVVDPLDEPDIYPTAISDVGPDTDTLEDSYSNIDEVCVCTQGYMTPTLSNVCPGIHGAYKAKIPVSKRKEYVDEADQGLVSDIRCDDCRKCKKCSLSDRGKMLSLQEKFEQEAIEKSVEINLKESKVYVDLPFIKPPVATLVKKHNGDDNNYKQAHKIYVSQCRRPEVMKDSMKKVHAELIEKSFMKKLCDLDEVKQQAIRNAKFQHYMPWRIAEKPDSLSTPYRMVVDASVTGLNDILAKGENKMSKINHILIRNRCKRHVWGSDISKLYNQLHLKDAALPYGLFLFSDDLDPNKEPDIYVMQVAWYGVSPTGNQSAEALTRLVQTLEEEFPAAVDIIRDDLYVDDIFTGDNDPEVVEAQIKDTKEALSRGGFNLKYVVRSGEKPPPEASPDEDTLKILGYKWSPEGDTLQPGFEELNFNKKRRGNKRPNPFPIKCPDSVNRYLNQNKVTRRMVMSKIAEIWDPVGLWEPFKLQLKLDNQLLNGMDYDTVLDDDLQEHWKLRFEQFLQVPEMDAARCLVPEDAVDPNSIRLICLSDAAANACGCAIYASFEKQDGTYSCKLLTARSKLISQTIPRNELEAIKLMAETADSVKRALGDKVKETLYFTDSTIAMCWCHNLSKKLRMYTLYRVADIRRNILGSSDMSDKTLPLFHIDGKINIADLLTKPMDIQPNDLGIGSKWQEGMPWMTLPISKMPVTTYADLSISKEDEKVVDHECFAEPYLTSSIPDATVHFTSKGVPTGSHCLGCKPKHIFIPEQICYGAQDEHDHCENCDCPVTFSSFALKVGKGPRCFDVDPISQGWLKSIQKLSNIFKVTGLMRHGAHVKMGLNYKEDCRLCQYGGDEVIDPVEVRKIFTRQAKDYLFKLESDRIKTILPQKKLDSFIEVDGILYLDSRLREEHPIFQSDLGFETFFDNTEISDLLPVVLSDSELFFSYVIYVHNKVRPHSGVEVTMREISKTMMVLNNPRRIIQRVRRDCTSCRLIAKKTLELRLMNHPAARTHIAPPFYHCQMDTVFGFTGQPYKNARKSMKLYALVIVCILTGATNILALEGLETQDVVQALERHAARHGMPAVIYVDNGTQLIALENFNFKLRDLQNHVSDSMGVEIIVSNPKSHEERGRVESKVKTLRSMLEKLSIKADRPLTALQWETVFARISNMIDDLPLSKGASSNVKDLGWDIITPNRLKLGRNNNRSIEGYISIDKGCGPDTLLRRNQEIQKLWYQIFIDRIHHLIPRPDKWKKTDNINVGDIVLFTYTENAMGKNVWKLGKIKSIPKRNQVVISFPGNTYEKGIPKMKTLQRCPRNVSVISAAGEIGLNTKEYHEKIIKKLN